MKKKIVSLLTGMLLAVLVPMTAFARPEWPSDTGVQSEAGIVMDVDSGAVLFGQNLHSQKAPASITKILTALVVVEHADLDAVITYSHDAVYNVEAGSGNKNAIEEGDQMRVRDALYHMLLTSSNQSANALAEYVGGSREGFVTLMNEKIAELGCAESHFANPSGLNDETQLTTVYDMALIAKAAYENETLLEITSASSYRLPSTTNNPEGVTIYTEHKMRKEGSDYYYPYTVTGKTGYTSIAGQTLVTYAKKEDREQIAVTMKSTEFTHYSDTINLMDFGFQRFKNLSIAENETAYTAGTEPVELGGISYEPSDLSLSPDAVITVPKGASFADAEKTVLTDLTEAAPDGAVALFSYTYNGRKIGEAYLISEKKAIEDAKVHEAAAPVTDSFEDSTTLPEEDHQKNPEYGEMPSSQKPFLIVLLLTAAVGGVVCYISWQRAKERKEMEERRKRRRQRLEEMGCTQEEFERLRKARMEQSGRRSQESEAPSGEVSQKTDDLIVEEFLDEDSL